MSKHYSVTDARRELSRLLREVEAGAQVQITRRGEPVAVLISLREYRGPTGGGEGFLEAYQAWEADTDPADRALPDDYFDQIRARSPGRPVDL